MAEQAGHADAAVNADAADAEQHPAAADAADAAEPAPKQVKPGGCALARKLCFGDSAWEIAKSKE